MRDAFQKQFGPAGDIRIFRAPGRVNLIGEHTDYNLGFVLPIALDLATWVAAAPSRDGHLHVHSEDKKETWDWPVGALAELKPSGHWTDYVAGVAQQLLRTGIPLAGQKMLIRSTVPDGAGLSSSAAIEVSAALALLNGRAMPPLELAKLCQRAEREFVGVPSGIMDQYIAVFGHANAAVLIDCRSLEHELVELPSGGLEIWAVNSMVRHALGNSAYRERVEQCASAVDAISRRYPEVKSLRDATVPQLESTPLPNILLRRARHVVTENARVKLFVKAARRADAVRMGELFLESHMSMQHDYEISCEEIDFLVQAASGIEGVYGARMTGGGFGGCTVNLVRSDAAGRFHQQIAAVYRDRFAIDPPVFRCVPSAGAAEAVDAR
jgi:galactokinase